MTFEPTQDELDAAFVREQLSVIDRNDPAAWDFVMQVSGDLLALVERQTAVIKAATKLAERCVGFDSVQVSALRRPLASTQDNERQQP